MWERLLLTRCKLRGAINYSRRLCVPHIQWQSADPTADIPPRILSGSDLSCSLLLYKASEKRPLLFFLFNIQELQRTLTPSLHKCSRPLNLHSHFCEESFPEKIFEGFRDCCKDTRKFSFFYTTPILSQPPFSAR